MCTCVCVIVSVSLRGQSELHACAHIHLSFHNTFQTTSPVCTHALQLQQCVTARQRRQHVPLLGVVEVAGWVVLCMVILVVLVLVVALLVEGLPLLLLIEVLQLRGAPIVQLVVLQLVVLLLPLSSLRS